MLVVKIYYPNRQFTKISQRKHFSEELEEIIKSASPPKTEVCFYFLKTEKYTPKQENILVEIDACSKKGSFHIKKIESRVSEFLKNRFGDVTLKVTSAVHSNFHHLKNLQVTKK